MKRRAALLQRIERRYGTRCETIRLGGLAVEFTRVADPEGVLEALEAEPTDAAPSWPPYWAEAWDTAFALAERLVGAPPADTLDLGCGMGLTGAIAAAAGSRVTLVDVAAPALLFAQLNTWPWRERVQLRQLDWRQEGLPGRRFARIIGSDILYDRADWPYLHRFWRRHLAPGGSILLGEPGRSTGAEFLAWSAKAGWLVQPLAPSGPTPPRMRILQLTRPGQPAQSSGLGSTPRYM